ncbi:hypothetical protein OGATHE_002680 [Ogataea polymorpha]|uniref:Uncharacterized protein n=1 Tax=Ogataea polymorpha TaxID=460523 RepID=A0A9P8PCS2_9ASCO|nr:hypothetical protein OGATHE_002680 [Ogataea polymorpha]
MTQRIVHRVDSNGIQTKILEVRDISGTDFNICQRISKVRRSAGLIINTPYLPQVDTPRRCHKDIELISKCLVIDFYDVFHTRWLEAGSGIETFNWGDCSSASVVDSSLPSGSGPWEEQSIFSFMTGDSCSGDCSPLASSESFPTVSAIPEVWSLFSSTVISLAVSFACAGTDEIGSGQPVSFAASSDRTSLPTLSISSFFGTLSLSTSFVCSGV